MKEAANRHERRKNDTHALILATAGRLMEKAGADTLSLDAIAAEADLSRATLFNHFHSRDELLTELLSPAFDECLLMLKSPRGEADSGDCLLSVARACLFMWERHRGAICRPASARSIAQIPALDRKHRALAERFTDLFRAGYAKRRFRLPSPESSALLAFRTFIPILDSLPSDKERDKLFLDSLSGLLLRSGS